MILSLALGECQTLITSPLASDHVLSPCRGETGPTHLNFLEKLQRDMNGLSQVAGWMSSQEHG